MKQKQMLQMRLCEEKGVTWFRFKEWEGYSFLNHAFSTRLGGISEGVYASMNFRRGYGDTNENVLKNYRIFCEAAGFSYEKLVLSQQTHTANVRRVGKEDAGNGILFLNRFHDIDGLVTNEPGITLVTFYADCVPLFFVDKNTRSIGLSHGGWRGTVSGIGPITAEKMVQCFGSRKEDICVAIGPSICKACYEVGKEVAEAFREGFSKTDIPYILEEKGKGKYQLDLWEAHRRKLISCGIPKENIIVSGVCTKEHPQLFFSHRGMGDARGTMCAFLSVKEVKQDVNPETCLKSTLQENKTMIK